MSEENKKSEVRDSFLDFCDVMCPSCNQCWVSSSTGNPFLCLKCQCEIDPKRHIVVDSENEVN